MNDSTTKARLVFLIEIYKNNGISRNTGKCELGGFSLRQSHIMPSVKQILAQIGESTIFSKLDANVGFC